MFFQWRASRSGTEQFHSAMLPHAGRDSRMFEDIVRLGGDLARLNEVMDTVVSDVQVAFLHDNEAGWALKSGLKPINQPSYAQTARALHNAFFDRAVTVDVLPAWSPLDGYRVVVVPGLFLASEETARRVADFASAGGTVIVTWFSGVVDTQNTVITGGYPGAFRDLLGVRSEEFAPLTPEQSVELDNGWRGVRWSERVRCVDSEVISAHRTGALAGLPAVTRRSLPGGGAAWYLSVDLDEPSLADFVQRIIAESGILPVTSVSPGVEAVRRASETASYLFLINHTESEGWAEASGTDLLTGETYDGRASLPAGAVAVIRET
jgi:beta-galactosidase